jgi:hypothetical protein
MIRWLTVRFIDNAIFAAAVVLLSLGFILRLITCACALSGILGEEG